VLVTGADHADDLQIGQGGDFLGIQAQRAAGQDRVDLAAVPGDGLGAFGGRWRQDQVKALMFEDGQIIIDGFDQYQNGCRHAWLLWASVFWTRTSVEIAGCRTSWQSATSVPRHSV
jgi:hypothetical protein